MTARMLRTLALLLLTVASTSCSMVTTIRKNTESIERSVLTIRTNTDVVQKSTESMSALAPALQRVERLEGPLLARCRRERT